MVSCKGFKIYTGKLIHELFATSTIHFFYIFFFSSHQVRSKQPTWIAPYCLNKKSGKQKTIKKKILHFKQAS